MTGQVSIARFAPLDDMALAFDGNRTIAQGVLPADLIPARPTGGMPFSLTFWMNPQPSLAPADPASPNTPTLSGPVVVIDIRGAQGPLATWSIERDLRLSFSVPGSTAGALTADLAPFLSQWIFVASSYTPPDNAHQHGQVGLLVTNGRPLPAPTVLDLQITPNPAPEDRVITIGNLPQNRFTQGLPDLGAFQGMISRLRLWATTLGPADVSAHMYDAPIGPKGRSAMPVIGDWRMNEGYGATAFDYANPGPPLLPVRYQPPTGNHLTLGMDEPGTEPAWVIADVVTMIRKMANQPAQPAQASTSR